MYTAKTMTEDTIVAISTPAGEGGIGIIRMSGPEALSIADRIFLSKDSKKPSNLKTYTIHYGHIVDKHTNDERVRSEAEPPRRGRTTNDVRHKSSADARRSIVAGEIIDEVLLTVMRAPRSYTKEDVVEINCHGGIQALREVLDLVVRQGARIAHPGEFTKRAFLNGRLDLAQAEAVGDIIRAKTESSRRAAMSQLEGGLSNKVGALLERITDIAASVEASIDFPEEGLDVAGEGIAAKVSLVVDELQELIASFGKGVVLREGILAVICGKPNVGKSSLMNLLLKRDRVIVTPLPGTTRDAVEELINLSGVPIRLADTAGIAQTKDALEMEGVKRSKRYLEFADIVLFMLDGSAGIDRHDMEIAALIQDKKRLVLVNKTDLPQHIDKNALTMICPGDKIVEISVKKNRIDALEKGLLEMVWDGAIPQGESAIVTNARHKELLEKALHNMSSVHIALSSADKSLEMSAELVAIDLKEAIFNLGLIIGRSVSGDILDRIFEEFCIGK